MLPSSGVEFRVIRKEPSKRVLKVDAITADVALADRWAFLTLES